MERAPDRIVAGIIYPKPVGHRPENPDVMYNSGRDVWAPELLAKRPDLTMAPIEAYLHNLYRLNPDFVYSVSRNLPRSCLTPMLVLPDEMPTHPVPDVRRCRSVSAECHIDRLPLEGGLPELKTRAIDQVRAFLRSHQPQEIATQ